MTKRKIYLLLLLLLAFVFVSCDETKETNQYENWQARNEAFIDSLQAVYDAKSDPDLKVVLDERSKKNVFYKVISKKATTVTQPPYYTSTVKMYYRGMLINESVFGLSSTKYYTTLYKNLTVFDQNFKGDNSADTDTPSTFAVNGVVSGWTELLQKMVPGERYEAYIPYQSAYGSSGNNKGAVTIPGYTTLIFDMEMVEIVSQ